MMENERTKLKVEWVNANLLRANINGMLSYCKENSDVSPQTALLAVLDCIKSNSVTIDAADVVEVVRCEKCEYRKRAKVIDGFLICPASGMEITDNDYCSYGERKGGAEK